MFKKYFGTIGFLLSVSFCVQAAYPDSSFTRTLTTEDVLTLDELVNNPNSSKSYQYLYKSYFTKRIECDECSGQLPSDFSILNYEHYRKDVGRTEIKFDRAGVVLVILAKNELPMLIDGSLVNSNVTLTNNETEGHSSVVNQLSEKELKKQSKRKLQAITNSDKERLKKKTAPQRTQLKITSR